MKDPKDQGTMELIESKWDTATNIESALQQLTTEIGKKREAYNAIRAKMDEKKAKGLIYAGTHYKAGKYLYLIYPTDSNGERERKYIGADEDKIREALEGIERGIEYRRLEVRLQQIESDAHQCYNNLCYAFRNLKG